jgi:putative hydrolase of the HAD superfamily
MKTFIFDLDNTLYPQSLNVFGLIDKRINRYMREKLNIPEDEVDSLRRSYWKIYGVTLNGLMINYNADPEDYLEFVHDVELNHILKPNQRLRRALQNINSSKVILTNGSTRHAENVLSALGIEDMFQEIFDVRVASFKPKPFPEPYLKILDIMNIHGQDCVMVDDIPENLKTAKDLGMKTILIGRDNGHEYIDYCLEKACIIGEMADSEI